MADLAVNVLQSVPFIPPKVRLTAKHEREETMKSPQSLPVGIARLAWFALVFVLLTALAQSAEAQEKKTKVERLLKAELDDFWVDENGWTQLHWAAAADDGEAARRLLELGANPNITDNSDGGDFNIKGKQRLKLLGKKHAQGKNIGLTPLHAAALLDSPAVASVLIAGRADSRAKTNSGLTPLHFAALLNKPEVAALLIEGGAAVNAEDKRGETPLDYAVERGKTEVEVVLRENQAKIGCNKEKYRGTGMLWETIKANDAAGVQCAISNGADIEAKDRNGRRPLHQAAYKNVPEIAKLLIDAGAEVNAKGENGETPLHMAARWNAVAVAKMLIEKGADVKAERDDGETPLFWAMENNTAEIVKLLIEKGADVNAKAEHGYTPLHWAARWNAVEIAKLLIDRGADVNAKIINGKTPMDWAIQWKNEEMQSFLKQHGGECSEKC